MELLRPGAKDVWHTKRPPSTWKASDRLFSWASSPILSVTGLAELSKPRVRVDNAGETLFEVVYRSYPLRSGPAIAELRKTPVIREASFLKSGPATTVQRLSTDQAEVLDTTHLLQKPWTRCDLGRRRVERFGAIIPDFERVAGLEGTNELVSHFIRERDRRLIQLKKQAALKAFGRLACEICSFDFRLA